MYHKTFSFLLFYNKYRLAVSFADLSLMLRIFVIMNRHNQYFCGTEVMLSLTFLLICILIPISTFCQQNAHAFKDLNDPQILKLLFDIKKMNSNDVALWKPNFAESSEFNVSTDGLCHTNIDTVMEY